MKGHRHIARPTALVLALLGLAGCGPNYSPNTYDQRAVQQANKVEQGVIVGVRQIDIASPGTTGAIAGAAAGGIAGAQAQEGSIAALTALGGGLVGGILGTTVDKQINDTTGFEYIVRKANGDMVSVTQKDEKAMAIGLHVLVIAGPQARIVADYTVPVETNKQPTAVNADPASVAKPATPPPATDTPSEPRPTATMSAPPVTPITTPPTPTSATPMIAPPIVTVPPPPDAPPPVTASELRPAPPPPAADKPVDVTPLPPPAATTAQPAPDPAPSDTPRTE